MNMFLPLMIVAVSAHAQFMSGLMFRDPKAFVATFANADPTAINKVIEMVNGMIDVGESEKQKAISDHATAVDVSRDSDADLAVKQDDLIYKKGELHIATDIANQAGAINVLKGEEEVAALNALNAANVHLAEASAFMDSETARIDSEKSVLEEVAEILEGLKSNDGGSRRLLSASPVSFLASLAKQGLKVDPAAIDAVLGSIAKLIEEGESLRADASAALDASTSAQASRSSEYDESVECHVRSQDFLEARLEDKGMYQSLTDAATVVHNEALDTKATNDADRDAKLLFKESEIARVNSETKDLEGVKELLKGLL